MILKQRNTKASLVSVCWSVERKFVDSVYFLMCDAFFIAYFTDGLQRISREEGIASLWSGTGPSLVLAGNPAIQFMVYEAIKKFLMDDSKKVLFNYTVCDVGLCFMYVIQLSFLLGSSCLSSSKYI